MDIEAPSVATRSPRRGWRRRPWIVWTVSILAALLLIYTLIGYLVLPGLIKRQAEQAAQTSLHRVLTIERVQVQPFALRVLIHGAQLREADGQTIFASIEDIRLRLSLASVRYLAPVIREFLVSGAHVHLVRSGPNRYNTDDIAQALSQPSKQPPQPPAQRPARFSVYNIRLDGAQIDFDDQPVHAHHTIRDLRVGIPFISSLPSKEEIFVEPLLSAIINDAPLTITGKARPFAPTRDAMVDLDLDKIDIPKYLAYLPFEPRFRLPSAQLDVHLHASFLQPVDQAPALVVTGSSTLRDLQLQAQDGKPVLSLPQLDVVLDRLDPQEGDVQIGRIALTRPQLFVARNAGGQLNLMSLMPPQQESSGTGETGSKLRLAIHQFALEQGAVQFQDANPQRPLRFGAQDLTLRLEDLTADTAARRITLGGVESAGAKLDLQQGLAESERAGAESAASTQTAAPAARARAAAPQQPASAAPPWTLSLGKMSITGWSALIRTLGLRQPSITSLSDLSLQAEGLSTAPASPPGHVDLSAKVDRRGSLRVAGTAGVEPLHADLTLDLKQVDLLPLQPYVTEQVNLLITRAELSGRGRLVADQKKDGTLQASFRGQTELGNVATIDKAAAHDFLNWKSLTITGINASLSPFSVDIDQIALSDFFARVIVDPSGRINLQDIVRTSATERRSLTAPQPAAEGEAASTRRGKTQAQVPAPSAPTAPLGPIRIRQVTLQGGHVQYTDNFIKPNYSADLADLGGTISGLSSKTGTAADVDLRGSVNNAPLLIGGRINPVQNDLYLDVRASVHGMELSPLSPYSDKYVGYGIERGKLSFEVSYKLEHRQLTAQNRLILDQLTLGDKVDSPSAVKLPVRLALALLKDRNGVIDVDLPIGGSLDDPQFSVGGLIVRVLVNLITKAVTAPFSWLGSMFGHGEELQYLEFASGSDRPDAKGEERLQALAKALQDRPNLNLDIQAEVDRPFDAQGLRREELDRTVRTLKAKDLAAKGQPVASDAVTVSPQEYPALLQRVYQAAKLPPTAAAPASGDGKAPAVPEMEKALLTRVSVDDARLIDLGNRREQAVEQWLQSQGHVARDRLSLIAPALSGPDASQPPPADAQSSRIKFSLR